MSVDNNAGKPRGGGYGDEQNPHAKPLPDQQPGQEFTGEEFSKLNNLRKRFAQTIGDQFPEKEANRLGFLKWRIDTGHYKH